MRNPWNSVSAYLCSDILVLCSYHTYNMHILRQKRHDKECYSQFFGSKDGYFVNPQIFPFPFHVYSHLSFPFWSYPLFTSISIAALWCLLFEQCPLSPGLIHLLSTLKFFRLSLLPFLFDPLFCLEHDQSPIFVHSIFIKMDYIIYLYGLFLFKSP